MRTRSILVPPPPIPPSGRVGAGSSEPPREPSRARARQEELSVLWRIRVFWQDVRRELARVAWPSREQVGAGFAAMIGLLCLFALGVCSLGLVFGLLLRALGLTA